MAASSPPHDLHLKFSLELIASLRRALQQEANYPLRSGPRKKMDNQIVLLPLRLTARRGRGSAAAGRKSTTTTAPAQVVTSEQVGRRHVTHARGNESNHSPYPRT